MAAKPVARSSHNEALRCVALSAADGTMVMRGTDMDLWCEARVQCDGELAPTGLNAERLIDALTTMRGDTVTLECGKTVTLTCGQSVRKIPMIPAERIPPMRDIGEAVSVEIDGGDLAKALDCCLPAIDVGEVRENLRGVHFGNRYGLAGTDGKSFGLYDIGLAEDGLDATASLGFCRQLKAMIGEGRVALSFGDRSVGADFGHTRLVGPLVQEKYPDLDPALKRVENHRLEVHPAEISAAVQAVRGFGRRDTVSGSTCIVMELGGECALSARDYSTGESREPFDAKYEGEGARFGIASSRLADAVKPFGNEPILIEIDGPQGRAKFTSRNMPGVLTAVAFMHA